MSVCFYFSWVEVLTRAIILYLKSFEELLGCFPKQLHIFILTSSVQGFQFLHSLANNRYFVFLNNSHLNGYLTFDLHFPDEC